MDEPRYKHHQGGRFLGRFGDYDLYVRWGDGGGAYQCLAVARVEEMNVANDQSAWTLREIFREAVKRWDLMEKETPMMTLHIDEHGHAMSGGHNVQSIPKDRLRDLSSEEPIFIDDKLQGAFDKKNRQAGMGCANMNYLEMEMVRVLGVPPEMLGIATLPPSPGPFLKGRYEVPIHAFGLSVDHPGFQRPAPPAKEAKQEVRASSLFGSDVQEAHTKESDDRRERFKMALRHNFPPSMPFDPENVEGGDVCLKEMSLAAAELKLSSEPRFRWDQGREGRKHTFEWHFIDNMRRPSFGFQVRFWAEAPTKEEAWKTLEAGVMAFAGKDEE